MGKQGSINNRILLGAGVLLALAGTAYYGLHWRPAQIQAEAVAANRQGDELRAQGQVEAAEPHYRRAVAIKPDFAQAWANQGTVQAALQRYAEARGAYETALRLQPDLFEARIGLAVTLDGLGEFLAAESNYKQALQLRPDFAEIHYKIGRAHV